MVPMETPKKTDNTDRTELADAHETIDQTDLQAGTQDSDEISSETFSAAESPEADIVDASTDFEILAADEQKDQVPEDSSDSSPEDDAVDGDSGDDATVGGIGSILPLAEDLRIEAKVEAIIFASPKPMRATEIYEILLAQERDQQKDEAQPAEAVEEGEASLSGAEEFGASHELSASDDDVPADDVIPADDQEETLIDPEIEMESASLPESPVEVLEKGLSLRQVQDALDSLSEHYRDRCGGFHLAYIKRMGYQFQTVPAAAALMEKQFAKRPRPISRASLETLSIIAYRQPCTRAEVEFVRGVDAGSIIHTLMERGMIACVGRKEIPGRPMLFGTTEEFLRTFQLGHVKDLPSLESFQPANDAIKAAFEKLEAGPESTDVEEFIGDEDYEAEGSATLEESASSEEVRLDPSVAEAARELMTDTLPESGEPTRIVGASAFDTAASDSEMDMNDGTDSIASLDFPAGPGDQESSGELDS